MVELLTFMVELLTFMVALLTFIENAYFKKKHEETVIKKLKLLGWQGL